MLYAIIAWLLSKNIIATIDVAIIALLVTFVTNNISKGRILRKRGALVLSIILIILISCLCMVLKPKAQQKENEEKSDETVEVSPAETTDDEDTQEENSSEAEPEEETKAVEGSKTSAAKRTSTGAVDVQGKYTKVDGTLVDAVTATTESSSNGNPTEGKEKTTGSDVTSIGSEPKNSAETYSSTEDDRLAADKAAGKDVTEKASGITVTSNQKTSEETKTSEVNTKEKVSGLEAAQNAVENSDEKVSEEAKPSEITSTATEVVEEIKNSTTTAPVVEEIKSSEETKTSEQKKSIGITPIDSLNTTVGSSVQVRLNNVDHIEGLEGIDYTFKNNILTVNTGSEATVITVEVSNSAESASFDIVVNGVQ